VAEDLQSASGLGCNAMTAVGTHTRAAKTCHGVWAAEAGSGSSSHSRILTLFFGTV
jgi:hypothetical protein